MGITAPLVFPSEQGFCAGPDGAAQRAVNKLRAVGFRVFAMSERGYEISFIKNG